MDAATATMEVRREGTVAIIAIAGELTPACEPAVDAAWLEAVDADAHGVVLDFSGLTYMNSGGIGLLVTLLVRANRHKKSLAAFGLDEHYRQILALTRLDEAIAIHDSEAAAIAGVRA